MRIIVDSRRGERPMTFARSADTARSDRESVLLWKLNQANPRHASVRYRCLMPLFSLRERGIQSVVLSGGDDIVDFSQVRALVFVKTFSDHDVDLALRAHRAGVSIIFDLCENIFVSEFAGPLNAEVQRNFQCIVAVAEGVVTTGPALADKLLPLLPSAVSVWVIPDQVERYEQTSLLLNRATWDRDLLRVRVDGSGGVMDLQSPVAARRSTLRRLRKEIIDPRRIGRALRKGTKAASRRLRGLVPRPLGRLMRGAYRKLRADIVGRALAPLIDAARRRMSPSATVESDNLARKTVVWFGFSGSSHGRVGMITLAECLDSLARINQTLPLRLRVISNNRDMFNEIFEALPFPAEYLAWDPLFVFDQVGSADVCIVPNSRDAFSSTKSANRAVLALSLGVPVVATRIPSMEPLQGCVVLDDWDAGLRRYLGDPDVARADVAKANKVIATIYSPSSVGEAWYRVIDGLDRSVTSQAEIPHRQPSVAAAPGPFEVAHQGLDHPESK